MTIDLLNLPNEIIEIIALHVISGLWKNDVQDFLSLTSSCRRLYHLSHDERYWKQMVTRRDPAMEKPSENMTWLEYCKKIYLMRTIRPNDLENNISQFNAQYFCTIEKVLLWPDKIRIYIDERGDYSLGIIQDPTATKIAFSTFDDFHSDNCRRISSCDSHFSIEDSRSQFLGYLDFPINLFSNHIGKSLLFQYGTSGYSTIRLFRIDQAFIAKYNLVFQKS